MAYIELNGKWKWTASREDLTGRIIGNWTVSKRNEENPNYWHCQCVCGAERIMAANDIRHSRPKSCGCVKRVFKRKDLTGKKFGYWVVLGFAEKRNRYSLWNCRCVCGKEKAVLASTLMTGSSKSCGCKRKPPGYSKSPTYRSWMAMRQRCNNPKSDNYARYGALGITVCRSWNKSFKDFLKDMGIRPEGTTLDRIENSKGYFPGNVRWATPAQQGPTDATIS